MPHFEQPIVTAGPPVDVASSAMIMIHGRGASAENILTLRNEFDAPDMAYLAPQAYGNSWYPFSFMAPEKDNEPGLSAGLKVIKKIIEDLAATGIDKEHIYLLGFSQGACLAVEYAARHAEKFGGIFGLSGGLIGEKLNESKYKGDFENTPVFLGCSDKDPHIPLERVHETGNIFEQMNASVTKKIYPGMPHTINEDEIENVRNMLPA